MDSLENIISARRQLDEAKSILTNEAKRAVNDAVSELLADVDVKSVSWAQKASEYNDEGMYPGVFGPVLNHSYHDLEDRWEDSTWYATLYGYEKQKIDGKLHRLKTILDNLGADILSDIFGDEAVVDATLNKYGLVSYYTEYAGV